MISVQFQPVRDALLLAGAAFGLYILSRPPVYWSAPAKLK